jgi:hypothetical protein
VKFLLALTDDRVARRAAPFDQPEIFVPIDGQAPIVTGGRHELIFLTTTSCSPAEAACFRQIPATGRTGMPGGERVPGFLGVTSNPDADCARGRNRRIALAAILLLALLWWLWPRGRPANIPERLSAPESAPGGRFDPPPVAMGEVTGDLRVSFALDPLLTRGIHMGERWVSPPTFMNVRQAGPAATLRARAGEVDARGRTMRETLEARWIPSDPDMVSVRPAAPGEVTIVVHRPGESELRVVAGDRAAVLTVRSVVDGDAVQAIVSQ